QNLYAGVRFSPAPPIFSCSSLKSLRLLPVSASSSVGLERPDSAKIVVKVGQKSDSAIEPVPVFPTLAKQRRIEPLPHAGVQPWDARNAGHSAASCGRVWPRGWPDRFRPEPCG